MSKVTSETGKVAVTLATPGADEEAVAEFTGGDVVVASTKALEEASVTAAPPKPAR